MATPGRVWPIVRAVGVRIFLDVCTTGGWLAAIALPSRKLCEFTVSPKRAADQLLPECIKDRNEITGLEMFAMVSGVVALGDHQRGKRVILFRATLRQQGPC